MFNGESRIDDSGAAGHKFSGPRGLRFTEALLMTIWFGLVAGLIEAAIKAVQKLGFHQPIFASRDFFWMAPLAGVVFFTLFGLVFFAVTLPLSRFGRLRLVAFVMAFLGLFNLFCMYPRFHRYAALALAAGGGVQIARLIASRADAFHRMARRTVLWMTGLVVVVAVVTHGWGFVEERNKLAKLAPAPAGGPNVLLIVLDTVRAHNMSLYGYERATTPNLARMANASVVFERALSTAPWTLPSHAGMFTGRYPHELSADWKAPFDTTYPTLSEEFTKRGYLTAGFIANINYCSYEHGLDRGFIHYEDYPVSTGQLVYSLTLARLVIDNFRLRRLLLNDEFANRQFAEDVNRKFLHWLQRQQRRPFFVFLNYFDAHDPYLPPAPFDRKFGPGRKKGKHSVLSNQHFGAPPNHELSRSERQEEIDAYDGAIAYLDHQLSLLFADLRSRGLYDNTLIIVTSDHGEEFGEHGSYGHGNSLYLPSAHVPLLISFPGRTLAGRRVVEPVSLRDLPATIAELAGLPARFPGQTLARYWSGSQTVAAGSPLLCGVRQTPNAPEWLPVSKGDMSSLAQDGYRYIRNGDGREELYDFDRDIWEQNNLAERSENLSLLERLRIRHESALKLNDQTPGIARRGARE